MSAIFKSLLPYEKTWCKTMGYLNPYIDPFTTHLTNQMPFYDKECYNRYPKYQFVYDKLWIIKSQGLAGGRLEKLRGKEAKVQYPIFIKPRWGHLSATSKNCFKINSADELRPYVDYKHMIWSEFIDANEGMTDYILLKGKIVHQITYVYSEKQNGFSDDWKYISPASAPPSIITEWVQQHMGDFTGVVNVQYRATKIIEVGLRLARGGAYLVSTENAPLIENVNSIFLTKSWNYNLESEMKFKPFYVFKCFTAMPIIYIFPQSLINWFVRRQTPLPYMEYYFEPVGKSGMVFFQFMDVDFDRGMKTKLTLEHIFELSQVTVLVLFVVMLLLCGFTEWKYKYHWAGAVVSLWLTRIFNPISTNYSLYKGQKQALFGSDSMDDSADDIETFDMR